LYFFFSAVNRYQYQPNSWQCPTDRGGILFMSDRSTASQAAKAEPGRNGSFQREWGDPQEIVAVALCHFDEPAGKPLRRLLKQFHRDPAVALPDIVARIRDSKPTLSAFTQWIAERKQAGCADARALFAAGKPRRTGRSKAARARRRLLSQGTAP
jgi:hypothetical protein